MGELLQGLSDIPKSKAIRIESHLPGEHSELVLPPPAVLRGHNQTALVDQKCIELRLNANRFATEHILVTPSEEQIKLINILMHNGGVATFDYLRKEHGFRTTTFGKVKKSINTTFSSLSGALGGDFITQERQGDVVFIGIANSALLVPNDESIKDLYITPDTEYTQSRKFGDVGSLALGGDYSVRSDNELKRLYLEAQVQNIPLYDLDVNPAEFCRILSEGWMETEDTIDDLAYDELLDEFVSG